jgi:two-component system CheB/CheR fusion protein
MKDQEKSKEELKKELREVRFLLKDSEASQTSLKLAKSEAKNARNYAENIIETVRESLLVLDEDLKILSANQSFYETFKVQPGETIGSYLYDLGNRQWDIPRLRQLLEDILPQNNHFDDFEVEHNFTSIGHKIMKLNARQIHRQKTDGSMILLAIEDITGLRKLERERRNVFSMFAHDMKNPLMTSEGLLLRLVQGKAGALTEKQQKYIKTAFSELGKVSQLVAAFLEFSRLEAREHKPVFTQVDLEGEIRKNIEAVTSAAEKKQITICLEPSEIAIAHVNADAAMISRVIRNLFDNAIRHTDSGGEVTVKIIDRDSHIHVSVKDTGSGIPESHLPYIFDAFYRAERSSAGSGLGLAIARTVIELHGGEIWVHSTPLRGSTFIFSINKR